MSVVEAEVVSVPFEEAFADFDASQFYAVPNENLMGWRELLRGLPIYKAAAICSSGEVGLLSILPFVRRELVLIDHSRRSLHVAAIKHLLLQRYGWQEVRDAFVRMDTHRIQAMVKETKPLLPESLRDVHGDTDPDVPPVKTVDRYGYPIYTRAVQHPLVAHAKSLSFEWSNLDGDVIERSCSKLAKVKYVHGDLTDLAGRGMFNLLYLSNALEHTNRNRDPRSGSVASSGGHPNARVELAKTVTKIVKPGGYVIACGKVKNPDWEEIRSFECQYGSDRDYHRLRWTQTLYRVPEAA